LTAWIIATLAMMNTSEATQRRIPLFRSSAETDFDTILLEKASVREIHCRLILQHQINDGFDLPEAT
jgi:hypothetical protein